MFPSTLLTVFPLSAVPNRRNGTVDLECCAAVGPPLVGDTRPRRGLLAGAGDEAQRRLRKISRAKSTADRDCPRSDAVTYRLGRSGRSLTLPHTAGELVQASGNAVRGQRGSGHAGARAQTRQKLPQRVCRRVMRRPVEVIARAGGIHQRKL